MFPKIISLIGVFVNHVFPKDIILTRILFLSETFINLLYWWRQ